MGQVKNKERFPLFAAVYLILEKNGKILLMRRFKTGWQDGMHILPAGHLDGNEMVADSMAREALEKSGIIIKPNDLTVVHVVHHTGNKWH
jgi:ADP-ribose pyrophosphatase YjhB (NUDIX family)